MPEANERSEINDRLLIAVEILRTAVIRLSGTELNEYSKEEAIKVYDDLIEAFDLTSKIMKACRERLIDSP